MKRLLVPALVLVSMAMAIPVQAGPLVREHYGGTDSLADHGRHPGFYLDFCELAEEYFLG